MKINEALQLILEGDQSQTCYNEVKRYSDAYLKQYKKAEVPFDDLDEIVSDAMISLYMKKDTYDASKALPITWYSTIINNSMRTFYQLKAQKNRKLHINMEYGDGSEYDFEDTHILDPMHKQSETVRLYIEEQEPILYYYLYSVPFTQGYKGDRVTYTDVMNKYNISMQTAKNRIRLAKQKTIEYFTGESQYKKDRAKHCAYNKEYRLKKKQQLQNETN